MTLKDPGKPFWYAFIATVVFIIVIFLTSCSTIPTIAPTVDEMLAGDGDPRFIATSLDYPLEGFVIITVIDKETGRTYAVFVVKDNGMTVLRIQ